MSKKQIRRIKQIIILGALLGLIRSLFFLRKDVFAGIINNVLQSVINAIEQNEPTEKIFKGDAMVENIYKKTLNGQKRKKAERINVGLDKIQLINNNINIEPKDALNILYNSNEDVRRSINFFSKNTKNDAYIISPKEIGDSYNKVIGILQKEGIITNNNNNIFNRTKVDNRMNSQFIIASNSQSFLQAFEEATIGEDLFVNGVADDSEYDLQIDMQNIGDLLFESFIAPIETVFYKLPQNYANHGSSSNNNQNSNTTDRQSLINILQNTLNPSGSTNTGIITNGGSQPSTIQNRPTTNNQTTTNENTNNTKINDDSLQNFVQKNSLNQKATTQLAGIQGDICREGVDAGPIIGAEDEQEIDQEAIEEYLETIQGQIENYNNIYPENQITPNITDNPAFEGMTPEQANQFIQEHINDLLNVESTESCLNNCNSLPTSEKVICQIQCLCFTMVWPNDPDPRVKSMNEMLKLRFCMVPAASMAIPKGKNIYSLDNILTRIQANMSNLINNGEMVKFQKTKEFLDSPIADFDFGKIISFQMNVNTKPIFNNKSEMAKKDQEETYVEKLEKASGKEQQIGTDYNKYLVIQDTVKNKVFKKYAESATKYEDNYQKEKLIEEMESRQNKAYTPIVNTEIIERKSEILTTIVDFLSKNLDFWQQTEKELTNINNIIFSLQSKL